ncbi:MAG: phosphoribosyltransferase family protein [Gemmatimonadota bacterium]|jgi:hypoxanthine phosphoribosyltransferase
MTPEPSPNEYLDLDWAMFGELCRALALKVARDYDPEVIIGITRAGVIPAAVVSSILGGVDFYSLRISRKDGEDTVRERPAVFSEVPPAVRGKRVLIVDEITTSGDTLRLAIAAVRDKHPTEIRTATSFARNTGYQPDYAALTMEGYVIFPWDRQVLEGDQLVTNPLYEDELGD